MGRWSELPVNLLEIIEDHLVLYADKVRIRTVCLSWSIHLPRMPNHKERQFPWLLQALDNNKEASHALFNPIKKKFYMLDLPGVKGKVFKGSSHGWVATVEDANSSSPTAIYLFNPLTRARIKLPPRNKFPDVIKYHPNKVDKEYSVFAMDEGDNELFDFRSYEDVNLFCTSKVVISSAPSSDDCFIVAIYGPHRRLACCKLKDKRWRPIPDKDYRGKTELYYHDIIFHKGKLHALLATGQLLAIESNGVGPNLNVTEIVRPLVTRAMAKYLVEDSEAGLIMVARYIHFTPSKFYTEPIPRTYYFQVFKVDSINSSWVEVKNIGDNILFLGLNTSLSISSCLFSGYKGNHIYFTDAYYSFDGKLNKQEDSDIGVFNLEDGTLQSIPGHKCNPKFLWPPPVWVNMG